MKSKFTTVIYLLCSLVVSAAQAQQVKTVISPSPPNIEIENETVKISGAFVVGAMFISNSITENVPSLSAWVPRNWSGSDVCVRGRSADGVYESKYKYEIPREWKGLGLLEFSYPTNYPGRVAQTDPNLFGVTINRGDCDAENSLILVGAWNQVPSDEKSIVALLINSLGADEAFIFVGDDVGADQIDCQHSTAEKPSSFDFVCLIDEVHFSHGQNKIEINTVSGGVRDAARFVSLHFEKSD